MSKKIIILSLFTLVLLLLLARYSIDRPAFDFIKKNFSPETKITLKKYLFVNSYLDSLNKNFRKQFYQSEINLRENKQPIIFENSKYLKLFNKEILLKKYTNLRQLTNGITLPYPGSAYLEFYENKLFILSSTGLIGFSEKPFNNSLKFLQIDNNINNFINEKQFSKNITEYGVRDLKIFDNMVFVSFTEEIEEECWGTSVIFADLNLKKLIFEKLFQPDQCAHSTKNIDNEFHAGSSGGRIIKFDDKNILFTHGDYIQRFLPQDTNSQFGKILKINFIDKKFELFSIGHRNPQGLFFNKEKNIILSTEHGPMGGDEINFIEINNKKLLNFGWPISSYGEHYGGKIEKNEKKYQKYPLHKSHKNFGFVEPIKQFTPSIGISEIIGVNENKYILASLKRRSLFTFSLNGKEVIDLEEIEIGERIRDIILGDEMIFLFLEDTASIGILYYK